MNTSAEYVIFRLKGSGIAIVDWGNGSKKDTVELEISDENGWSQIKRTDLDTNHRMITITSKNITGLDCDAKFAILAPNPPKINQITRLDVSQNAALSDLDCGRNQLAELDISKNTALTRLRCGDNQLTELNVSKNTALLHLECSRNQLTKLDVSKNVALISLNCCENPLTALDVSRNTALIEFLFWDNKITTLDISTNTALEHLSCSDNPLTELDVSRNTALKSLSCRNNQLTTLDVSRNGTLVYLYCDGNQLTADAINNLFGTLHDDTVMIETWEKGEVIASRTIYISNNPGTADCDRSIAERKSWTVE